MELTYYKSYNIEGYRDPKNRWQGHCMTRINDLRYYEFFKNHLIDEESLKIRFK